MTREEKRSGPMLSGAAGRRFCWAAALAALVACLGTSGAWAQFQISNRYELSEAVYLDEIDNAGKTHLTQFNTLLEAGQWGEALDALRQLDESNGNRLIDVGERRYISVRDYCQQRLCAAPAEALELYRQVADPIARTWWEQGQAARDEALLWKVVEETFASRSTDDALALLGELALERGDHSGARRAWQMILPTAERVGAAAANSVVDTLLVYPDTELSKAEINARLVLVSILEGRAERAQRELTDYRARYGDASGVLAGRQGKYADLLEATLAASSAWSAEPVSGDWPTFAGNTRRSRVARHAVDLGAKVWQAPLAEVAASEVMVLSTGPMVRRVTATRPVIGKQHKLLSYHPLVVDGLVLVNTSDKIVAYELATGKPAWGAEDGVIHRDSTPNSPLRRPFYSTQSIIPRYSMTADRHRLYARLGSPLTSTVSDPVSDERRGYLACLDLRAQGRLLWKIFPEEEKFAFEGAPVVAGDKLYVALRRSDVRPQAHVACYDADTGRQLWRRYVASAETTARGQVDEATSNLLTLDGEFLYLNTNLGTVAKLSTRDGHLEWARVYRQQQVGDLSQPHTYLQRDLTPCVIDEGRVFAAPSDSERIYALSAETGALLWDTRYTPDAIHLLGVAAGSLVASGERLYWIDVASGKLMRGWPDGESPRGFGRGVLAGSLIYWPTRTAIFEFDQASGELRRSIDLRGRDETATGGNLLIAERLLLIAGANRLTAFGEANTPPDGDRTAAREATFRPHG
jgi:outer membrane protein assembly factor BamB